MDADCYKIFENNGRQYISIMTLDKGKRLVIPLLGNTPIKGNIKVVLYKNYIEMHYTAILKPKKIKNEYIEAVDFGYTEVITDSKNRKYGIEFGKKMSSYSDKLNIKMKQRNKVHALQKKQSQVSKRKNIRKYNLGKIKLDNFSRKNKAGIEQEVNFGLNQFFSKQQPQVLITEDLRHLFSFGKIKSWNRKFSSWVKGFLQDRIGFKALARGSCHEQVNPAYGSQTCIKCGFVWKGNRVLDRFKCGFCGHEDYADRVAAMNYKSRYGDKEITRYTPFREVKTILDERFRRRLETSYEGTVPGRTSDTVSIALRTVIDTSVVQGGFLAVCT
ncbi:MAG: transposase [Desulfobacterales bacterium]|nr:transposase [Desulfobacterales bacterium]